MLFYKLEEYYTLLKPFLIFLHYLPEKLEFNNKIIETDEISLDYGIVTKLREVLKS